MGYVFHISEPLKRYEFGDFLFGDLQVVAKNKDVVVELFVFSERLRLVSLFFVEFTLPPLKTNDYPLIINGCFR